MTIGSNKPKNAAKPLFPPHLFSVLVCLYLYLQHKQQIWFMLTLILT